MMGRLEVEEETADVTAAVVTTEKVTADQTTTEEVSTDEPAAEKVTTEEATADEVVVEELSTNGVSQDEASTDKEIPEQDAQVDLAGFGIWVGREKAENFIMPDRYVLIHFRREY
jgi:hypothetical protein